MAVLHSAFSRSYDLERRLCGQVCKTSPMLWRKGLEKVLNFLLCIPKSSEVQSQSLAVGWVQGIFSSCALLLQKDPICHDSSLDYLSDPYVLPIELLAGYKRKLDFLYKVIPHGKVFSEFLTKNFVGCLQCHQSLCACLLYVALFV